MTKNDNQQGPKMARVATGGGHLKHASNGMTPITLSVKRDVPHAMWKDVKKSDIGTGYAAVETPPLLVTKKTMRESDARALPQWRNQFIIGSSPFIWFYIRPQVHKPKVKAARREPINFKNKLDDKTRRRFSKEMAKNIDATANLMVKDLLPISLSLHSALSKADELMQQLVDDKVSLPRDYLIGKAHMATNLRVIRFVSELYNLTPEERKLMALEYTRPWSQS